MPRVGTIVGALRNAEIGDGHVHPARPVFARKDQFTGVRTNAFGHHDACVTFLTATGKGHLHAAIALLYVDDGVVEAEIRPLF
ncbi:hypothetical protein M0D46_18960 [Xanthomonas prunicola]|nr:hypothetical protein M0D46_18960 [Xanthomonas prunicola]